VKFVPKRLHHTADVSRGTASLKGWVQNAISGLLTILLLYIGIGLATDLVVSNISEDTEARWFSWTFQALALASDDDDEANNAALGRAQAIFTRLIENSDVRPLPYELFLIDLPAPNALALPGGGVGVTTGLLERVNSETGLAMVLAHELGHHQGRHSLKRIGRTLVWNTLLGVALGSVDMSVLEMGIRLREAGYGRDQERDADELGMRMVHKVYGHTRGALEFFERVQSESGQDEAQWTEFMSTHPLTAERISDLKELQQELDSP
jgi:predicted Zn-dependent protease